MMFCFVVYTQNLPSEKIRTPGTDTSADVTQPPEAEKKYTIGWSVYNSSYEFFQQAPGMERLFLLVKQVSKTESGLALFSTPRLERTMALFKEWSTFNANRITEFS